MRLLFVSVFALIYALGALVTTAVQPDFNPGGSQMIVSSQLWHDPAARHADTLSAQIAIADPAVGPLRILVPAHTGTIAMAIDGQALHRLPDRPHTAITRYHRMAEFTVPPQSMSDSPGKLTITRSGPMRFISIPETLIGPEQALDRLASAQQRLVTLVNNATLATMAIGVVMSLLLLFVSRRIAHYAYLLLMFALLLALEFRDSISLLGHPLVEFIHYFGLAYLLLSALSFSHWTNGPASERSHAVRIIGGTAILCVLVDLVFGVASEVAVPIKIAAFVLPSLLMLAWVSLRLVRRVRDFDLPSALVFTFVAIFASAFGVALLTIWYGPIGAEQRLWLLCLTNSVEVTAFCGMLLSAAAIEIGRYRVAVAHHRQLDSIASGTILALDEEIGRLKREIESHAIGEERRRFTQDLHDGIGGQLLSLLIKARTGKIDADEMESEIGHCIADLRLITAALDADNGRLSDGLTAFAGRAEDQLTLARMALDWRITGDVDATDLPTSTTLDVLRIVQELLTNAIRHADADLVLIAIDASSARLSIAVSDTGKNFDPNHALRPARGLTKMQSRVRRLGGTMAVGQSPSGGAAISLTIPASLPCGVATTPVPPSALPMPGSCRIPAPPLMARIPDQGRPIGV